MITRDQKQEEIVEEKSIPANQTIGVAVPEEMLGKVARDYQKEIYSNPAGTTVREVTSNAIDAHRQAGTGEKVVVGIRDSVFFEGTTEEFYVVDKGLGMSKEFVAEEFFKMRVSTKNDRNKTETGEDLIGGWGIGGQSPYGYTDTWLLISTYDGVRTTYLCQRDQEGDWAAPVSEEEVDAPNGVAVRVPIEEGDKSSFEKEIIRQLRYLLPEIELEVPGLEFELPDKIADVEGASLYDGGVEYKTSADRYSSTLFEHPHVVMGGIPYKIDEDEVPEMQSYIHNSKPVVIEVGSGALDLNLSREEIDYTDDTLESLTGFKSKFKETLTDQADEFLDTADDALGREKRKYAVSNHGYGHGLSLFNRSDEQKALKNALNSIYGIRTRDVHGSSDLTSITGSKISQSGRSHDTKDARSSTLVKKLGKSPALYYLEPGESKQTIVNRYLADKHLTAYVVELDDRMGEDVLDCIREKHKAYTEVEFDRSKYRSGKKRPEGQIPAYKVDTGYGGKDWKPNDERIEDILDYPERYVWGYKSQRDELEEAKYASRATMGVDCEGEWKVIRVSKSNGRKLPDNRHVSSENIQSIMGDRARMMARLLKVNKLKKEVKVLSQLDSFRNAIDGACHLNEAYEAVQALAAAYRGGLDVKTFLRSRDVSTDDVDMPGCVASIASRLRTWASKLEPISDSLRYPDDGVEYFLRPRLGGIEPMDLGPIADHPRSEMSRATLDNEYQQ